MMSKEKIDVSEEIPDNSYKTSTLNILSDVYQNLFTFILSFTYFYFPFTFIFQSCQKYLIRNAKLQKMMTLSILKPNTIFSS